MIFICTCSQDGTVDLLRPFLGNSRVFRFDIDRPEDFAWDFSWRGFVISNLQEKTSIDSDSLSSFYLRKPMYITHFDIPSDGCLANWCREETDELFEDFFRDCESRGLTTIIRSRNAHFGKLRQMQTARKHFKVARWHIFHGILPDELKNGRWVVKALTGTAIGKGKSLFVKEVDPSKLDLSYPWFLQEKIDGEDEVTVVYLEGRSFAYSYPRSAVKSSDDVRLATLEDPSPWKPCELSPTEESAIQAFMSETGYRFGRFDFIRKDGELWFLELNPNGQWAWLDPDDTDGLISSIASAIIAEDNRHQLTANAPGSML